MAIFALDAGYPLVAVVGAASQSALRSATERRRHRHVERPPIIVTLASLSIVRGAALILGGPKQHLIRDEPAYSFIGGSSLLAGE